jgi:hypothetical protein
MDFKSDRKNKNILKNPYLWLCLSLLYLFIVLFFSFSNFVIKGNSYYKIQQNVVQAIIAPKIPPLDKVDYDRRLSNLANMTEVVKATSSTSTILTSSVQVASSTSTSTPKLYQTFWGKVKMIHPFWPVKTVYPFDGAILPFKRIIAYYGNFYSKGMGVLGQYPEDEVLTKLNAEVERWNIADPETPALPAIHYIVVTAQGSKGDDGKYRARMPYDQIDKAIEMSKKVNGIVFLDVQVALSTLQIEIPLLEKYLKMPEVNLGIDPEFSMKTGARPGTIVGTYDAEDVNFVIDYLAKIVDENHLPPKILVVHRYTQNMLTNYKLIKTVPEVQIVINMDGWGQADKKLNTYQQFIYPEPVQFTGFKLFYKNDTKVASSTIMTPQDLLKLTPRPIYIQYQ